MRNYIECKNCLVPTENPPKNCPVCGANYFDGTGTRILLNDRVRDFIGECGGIYSDPLRIEDSSDYLIWCEAGVLRINSEGEILWKTILAIVTILEIHHNYFTIHGKKYDLGNGKSI